MMFSDVDLLFTNTSSDDLKQNSVTSVIFIANVLEFTANKHGASSNFAVLEKFNLCKNHGNTRGEALQIDNT